jgi:YggT family protein
MTTVFAAIGYVVYLYIVVILARVVVEATRQFARKWRPVGVAAISLEVVYVATDPPIKLLRRVIPPVHVGGLSLDLSILILLLVMLAVEWVLSSYAV